MHYQTTEQFRVTQKRKQRNISISLVIC